MSEPGNHILPGLSAFLLPNYVPPRPSDEPVRARIAMKNVVAGAAEERVVARPSVKDVVSPPAPDDVVSAESADHIPARSAAKHVAPSRPDDGACVGFAVAGRRWLGTGVAGIIAGGWWFGVDDGIAGFASEVVELIGGLSWRGDALKRDTFIFAQETVVGGRAGCASGWLRIRWWGVPSSSASGPG